MCDLDSSPFGGGPKFEPLYRDMYDEDEDWNEFLGAEGVGGKKGGKTWRETCWKGWL